MKPPLDTRVLIGKAVQHQQRGEYTQAERLYVQVLAAEPGNADAHNLMGLLAHQTGRHDLGESHMRRSIELAPRRAQFLYNYGGMLIALGRAEQALREFKAALDIDPGMSAAWQGLAAAYRDMGLDLHAVACLQRVLAAEPERMEIWRLLGECLQSLDMLPEAEQAYAHAQRLVPADAGIRLALTTLAVESENDVRAETALAQLESQVPALPETHYQRGIWLAGKGRFEAARASLEKALELAPDFYQAALYYAYITPLPLDAPLVDRLSKAAARGQWSEPGQGANVHFALGYILDKDGQYDAAFRHFLEANRLQRSTHRYSTESQLRLQRSALHAFGPAFQARASRFADPTAKPLFIVGMPRSGTSLLEQVLSSHPQVHGGGEMRSLHVELRRRLGPAVEVDFGAAVASMPDAELGKLARVLAAQLDAMAPDKLHVTDKMPSNLTILGLIHALFPNARILYCRRDPLDTCVSCFTTSFKSGHGFSNDLRELGEYFNLGEAVMQQWRDLLPPGSVHELRYEAMVADMEGETRKLLGFCGLTWDDACLHFQDNTRTVSTASIYQVRQPVYRSAIGRWHRYATHLQPLQEALAALPLL